MFVTSAKKKKKAKQNTIERTGENWTGALDGVAHVASHVLCAVICEG